MTAQGFRIRANEKGKVIYHNETPLVICKGLFVKLAKFSFKLEGVSNETLKEVVKIAYLTKDKSEQDAIDMLHTLGITHCFIIHRWFPYDTIAAFEKGVSELT